ncbi:MAG TPA: hypothetical protein VM933_06380 [Acidimicrobiales bacterium]|nr:hypothetical protein [Acidimicrobiales bacterium]
MLALAAFVVGAPAASAHPLGNFTTNRYARIEAGARSLRVHYVLDEAELVAFRERAELARGEEVFATKRARSIEQSLRLAVDGRRLRLRLVDHRLSQPEGQGGLNTLRLEILYEAVLPADNEGTADVEFEDGNQPDRLGWREIVVRAVGDSRLQRSSVPAQDRTSALQTYPTDPSVAPLDVRRATFTYSPGTAADTKAELADATGRSGAGGDRFVGLVARTTSSPLAIVSALALALVFGGVHALGPGHGKTIMAAYLVSTSGRRRDAFYLGGVVSLMHTVSVLILAVVLATVGRNVDAARIYPGLTVLAGLLVGGVGLRLLARRWRTRPATAGRPDHHHGDRDRDDHDRAGGDEAHEHPHGVGHDHDDGHGPEQEQGHSGHQDPGHPDHGHHEHGPGTHTHELPADVAPLSRAGLVALGTSGGLFPSPSAVVVLVGAFALGRAALGLALIAAFSAGLALVLVTVGLLLVAGRDRIAVSPYALRIRWLPVAGAAAIIVLGAALIVQGVLQLSWL